MPLPKAKLICFSTLSCLSDHPSLIGNCLHIQDMIKEAPATHWQVLMRVKKCILKKLFTQGKTHRQIAEEMSWNRTISTQGGLGHNIAMDRNNAFINADFKHMMIEQFIFGHKYNRRACSKKFQYRYTLFFFNSIKITLTFLFPL